MVMGLEKLLPVLPSRVGPRRLSLLTFFARVGSGRLHLFWPGYNIKTKIYNPNRRGCRRTSKILKRLCACFVKITTVVGRCSRVDAPLLHHCI